MRKMNKKNYLFVVLIVFCMTFQLTGCGGGESASTSTVEDSQDSQAAQTVQTVQTIVPHEATQEQKDMILGQRQQALEGKVITSAVDQKFVNTKYMLTGLVNSDCVVTEDAENGFLIYVPSESAMIQINIVPGIQNATKAVNNLQQQITANYSQEGTGGTFNGTLMGYNATILPFTNNADGVVINGFASALIANQSLYTVNFLYYSTASENELALLEKVLMSLQVIKPTKVDNAAKKASYTDPYASYKVYDPYLYYYISGEWTYEDYLAAFTDYYTYADIASWYDLPYNYYSWYEGDYSYYTEEDFISEYNYYDDEDYWNWGWDDDTDWLFYDEYADAYAEEYYAELEDYYAEYSDLENYEYTAESEFEFSDDLDTSWEDVDLGSYEEADYTYTDYYDDYYYSEDTSYEDTSYEDTSYEDTSYEDTSYDDSGYEE